MKKQKPELFRLNFCGHKIEMRPQDYAPENCFESPEEALGWLQGLKPGEDPVYCYTSGDEYMLGQYAQSMIEWALEVIPAPDLDQLLLGFDPNRRPTAIEKHLSVSVGRCSTEALLTWIDRYPKSTYVTGRSPALPHVDAGMTRSQVAQAIVRELHRRGRDVEAYTAPQYCAPLRAQAYQVIGKQFRSCRRA